MRRAIPIHVFTTVGELGTKKNLEVKTIEYRKSTHLQDPPMQKMKVLAQFYDLPAKILLSKNCQKFG